MLEADYDNGATVYNYGYDEAGNLVNMDGTTRTYNAANQMTYDGTNTLTYDNNGNLTAVGANSYTWDRANRLLSHGGIAYAYDGAGNRISQDTLQYLLDVQPGLTVVLGDSDGNHFVHAVRGIHAQEDNLGNWEYMAQDGLGSVRGLVDDAAIVQSSMSYDPYGNPMGSYGAGFGFTGEQVDANDLLYLRARYYEPSLGVFSALDPFEGLHSRPMSLNGYSWVEGNPVMHTDPTGMTCECEQYLLAQNWQGFVSCVTNQDNHHDTLRDCSCYSETVGWTNDYVNPKELCENGEIPSCADVPSPRCDNSSHILNSSVVITVYRVDAFGNIVSGSGSLGTYTHEGIWTHDHFVPTEIVHSDGTTTYTPLQENVTFLNDGNTLIAFEGPSGRIITSGATLNVQTATDLSSRGSLLINVDANQLFEFSGDDPIDANSGLRIPSSLSSIGLQAAPTQNAITPIGDMLLGNRPPLLEYVFVPGQNSVPMSWSDLCVGTGVFGAIHDYAGSSTNAIYNFFRLGANTSQGDSGGGLFVDGNLIAVHVADVFATQEELSTYSGIAHFLHSN